LFVTAISWIYVTTVAAPWEHYVNVERGPMKAQMGDLYPSWYGTRELLYRGRNPYGPEVSDEIQMAYYGRVLHQKYDQPGVPVVDEQRFAYLAPDGFLAYRWQHGNDELLVERVIASSAAVTRAIWGIVASHSSIASTVQATVGPADPVQWLTTDPDVSQAGRTAWMLRVVDAAAAVAGRGYPPGIELSAVLRLVDPDRPAHGGWWTLDVGGGKGVLTPAGPGPDRLAPAGPGPGGAGPAPAALTLGPRGFAALYAGTPLATLRRAGLVAGGDPGGDAALDAAFRADPFMLEFF